MSLENVTTSTGTPGELARLISCDPCEAAATSDAAGTSDAASTSVETLASRRELTFIVRSRRRSLREVGDEAADRGRCELPHRLSGKRGVECLFEIVTRRRGPLD